MTSVRVVVEEGGGAEGEGAEGEGAEGEGQKSHTCSLAREYISQTEAILQSFVYRHERTLTIAALREIVITVLIGPESQSGLC